MSKLALGRGRWWLFAALVLMALLFSLASTQGKPLWVGVQVKAELPLARAWQNLADFSAAQNYVPRLTRTEIVSSKRSGVGAHRRVYDESGGYLEETIIEWQEGRGFVIKLHDGDQPMAPFDRSEFHYQLEADQRDTLIRLSMVLQLPWGGLGERLGDWFIRPIIESNLVQVAAGMKHYYETGEAATDEDRAALAEAVIISTAPEDS